LALWFTVLLALSTEIGEEFGMTDRDIDVLIGINFYGWHWDVYVDPDTKKERRVLWGPVIGQWQTAYWPDIQDDWFDLKGIDDSHSLPHYTKNIAAIWPVLDILKGEVDGWSFVGTLENVILNRRKNGQNLLLSPGDMFLYATPKDICIAALLIRGIEVEA
jgi:hypothetical protein